MFKFWTEIEIHILNSKNAKIVLTARAGAKTITNTVMLSTGRSREEYDFVFVVHNITQARRLLFSRLDNLYNVKLFEVYASYHYILSQAMLDISHLDKKKQLKDNIKKSGFGDF